AGAALRIGGLAAIGGLAWKAFRDYEDGTRPEGGNPAELTAPPAESEFNAQRAPQGEEAFARTLVQAMIAAAHSDGRVDARELEKIGERSAAAGFDDDNFLRQALEHPVGI